MANQLEAERAAFEALTPQQKAKRTLRHYFGQAAVYDAGRGVFPKIDAIVDLILDAAVERMREELQPTE